MSELFDIPPTLSPRLQWFERHDIRIIHNKGVTAGDEDDFGNELFPYCASATPEEVESFWDHATGYGNTQDDAIVDLAKKLGIKLWNEV